MNDYPVRVGSMLFTVVDPNPGHEKEYNRWYERDHFYAGCMIGPWLFAGSRWVCPRRLKDLRFPEGSVSVTDPLDAGSYVAIYWIHADHHEEHVEWATEQVHWLYDNGRGFAERTHRHTILADQPWAAYRDADPVPLELALDHDYPSLITVALDRAEGTDEGDLVDWLKGQALPELLAGSEIAIVSTWKPEPRSGATANSPMDLGTMPGGPERSLQLMFCEGRPEDSWDRIRAYADAVDESGMAEVVWASPWYATVKGTDTYVDELW